MLDLDLELRWEGLGLGFGIGKMRLCSEAVAAPREKSWIDNFYDDDELFLCSLVHVHGSDALGTCQCHVERSRNWLLVGVPLHCYFLYFYQMPGTED
jgi:hypothetical protein